MKRRVISLILAAVLCLQVCPAAAAGEGPCPHHPVHTDTCGYVPPTPEKACTHTHGADCYTTDCVYAHTAAGAPGGHICTEDSGCAVLTCSHVHDDACGYAPADSGAPCAFVCHICPIDRLLDALPERVSEDGFEQVGAQIGEIYDLYEALTADEQAQVDLSPCEALLEQMEYGSSALADSDFDDSDIGTTDYLSRDEVLSNPPRIVSSPLRLDLNGHNMTASSTVIQVQSGGKLHITGKGIVRAASSGFGVEVLSGGYLYITDPETTIDGALRGLKVSAGAHVQLSAGTYSSLNGIAFEVENSNFTSLLAPGCAYFDNTGKLLLPENVGSHKGAITVGTCDHAASYQYTADPNTPNHKKVCPACGTETTEPCTFDFVDGTGTCNLCGRKITVTVDKAKLGSLSYTDGAVRPASGIVTVTLEGGKGLDESTDYTVSYSTRAAVGDSKFTVTVTVTGKTYIGTFTGSYEVTKADGPILKWDTTGPITVDYTGEPVLKIALPVIINITTSGESLQQYLQYSYRTHGSNGAYISGLPTNAGTYDIVVSLPERPNDGVHQAVSSDPITLTINKIDPIEQGKAPKAIELTFNRAAQALVTSGTLKSAAAGDGAVILFATSQTGPYTTDIPTGTNAKEYSVWYKVEETENCKAVGPQKVTVVIKRKSLQPIVTLSCYSYLYDGGFKQPEVIVKDDDDVTVLLDTEYAVAYKDNQNVGTATVKVTDKIPNGGNYDLEPVDVTFQITLQTQAALSINSKPNTIVYGDQFVLGTEGGTGNGDVTWVTSDTNVAKVDRNSGRVTVTGVGTATVTATKFGQGNYMDATASWTFTSVEKPVVAIVTAEDKTYDGDNTAKVSASVAAADLVEGDSITIENLTGTFSDVNAGVGKTVTVNTTNAKVTGTNSEHYAISYSSTTVTATINKKGVKITSLPAVTSLTYNGLAQQLVGAAVTDPASIAVEYALSANGPYFTTIPEATDAGTYTVWYRVQETNNYTGEAPQSVEATIKKKEVTPAVKLDGQSPYSCYYDGTAKEPVVTLTDTNGKEIPSSAYTVAYSDNVNAGTATVTVTVKDDSNYAFDPETVTFEIKPKSITPTIILSETSYPYDGSKKTPQITVKDGPTVIDSSQYEVKWTGDNNQPDDDILRVVGEYTAAISNVSGGNYVIKTKATVKIVAATQDALHITGQPSHVYYGDVITSLDTVGGSGDGKVTWSITAGNASANFDAAGKLTVTGTGSVTVKAEREVPNYGKVSDTWTFTVEPKPVLAVVTVTPKDYDRNTTIADTAIKAIVNPSDLVGADTITITGLTGAYTDANAGTSKTVILDSTHATTTAGTKYAVSYPATATGVINPKLVTVTVTLSDHDLQDDASGYYYVYDGTERTPSVTVTANDNSATLAPGDYVVSYTGNKNVGTATVTVTNAAKGNYTFTGVSVKFVIKPATAYLTKSPEAKPLTYTGAEQELVTVGTAFGGHVEYAVDSGSFGTAIPTKKEAGTYVVTYKVVGDGNYKDSAVVGSVSVTIQPKEIISPVVTVDNTTPYTYNGSPHTPDDKVTVKDGSELIPVKEYTLVYTDNINAGTATVHVINANGGNYIVNGTGSFTIEKAAIENVTAPVDLKNPYNGTAQELVKAGVTSTGTMVYSLEQTGTYSPDIPTGMAKDNYTVWYKVQGNSNYNDSAVQSVTASIIVNTVTNPTIQVNPAKATYDGQPHEPTITVKDNKGFLIDNKEYSVGYAKENGTTVTEPTDVGKYKLTITGTGTNYTFTATATFEILPAGQLPLTINGTRERVYYGDTIQLGTTGGNGTVTWSVDKDMIASIDTNTGELIINGVGSATVTATCTGPNYSPQTAIWPFYADKKPVMAIVTAATRPYVANDTTATVTAALQKDDLVNGDNITIKLSGSFEDPNVGTNKQVNIDSTNPVFTNSTTDHHECYSITYPATTKASITPVAASVTTAPTMAFSLTYTGGPQSLVSNDGMAEGGNLVYSTDGVNYTFNIPTGTDAGTYPVWYKVLADRNHTDSIPTQLSVEIAARPVDATNLVVLCTPSVFQYDGTEKTPAVTVKADGRVIPESEYTVTYPSPRVAAKKYTVTVTDNTGGNYSFTSKDATFEITAVPQAPLSIITDKPTDVYYGDTFRLSAMGGSGDGAIVWSSNDEAVAKVESEGVVTVVGIGHFTIKAHRAADDSHSASNEASVSFTANKKPVAPTVTAADKVYDGNANAVLTVTWQAGDLVGSDASNLTIKGTFSDNANVGTGKPVKVTAEGAAATKYAITLPNNLTASITQATAQLATHPTAPASALTYNGTAQSLVTAGTTTNDIGVLKYSSSETGDYSTTIPTATDAGTYTVWYKVEGTANYTGIEPKEVVVTIGKATLTITPPTANVGTVASGQKLSTVALNGGAATGVSNSSVSGVFGWVNGDLDVAVGSSYEVIFTPNSSDAVNYNTATCSVTVTSTTPPSRAPARQPTTPQTTVQNGAATTVVSVAAGNRLVQEAAASQAVVIKPEISEDVTQATVSLPASTVGRLGSETDAALTVSSPVADVTIPNAALETLSQAGGTVSIVTEQVGQSVVVTLLADGESVENVPLTLSLPVEDAAPGTVAVLVHEDGTRETIRKSVVEEGRLDVPLSGSAAIEIVDNSKTFSDVPAGSWAADAVAFASAHELFNGTSAAEFSPDQAMSRGMLATVLYNLEGRPALAAESTFSDVSSDAWYAGGVAWAAANGITNGSGGGQFGPDDEITREQFAVMLWRYAGSPAANSADLRFTDADQVSVYAQEALCWATENGIINGKGGGILDPGGTATRAQAAQMLKNFLENAV